MSDLMLVERDLCERWPSEGRRLLALAVEAERRAGRATSEVARTLGISKRTLDALTQGTRRPSIDVAAAIERCFTIAASSWAYAQRTDDTPSVTPSCYAEKSEKRKPRRAA